ncbi:amino-acid N-acetyltransferase [Pelagibaculum spongiae]|uniref:Amino-acid acetyltransferase n=1 Tax=Pelagibaculum spongiae TaxID=2080658 RepID=A0A2V1GYI4_9GAMM|nr:amino-acid N-acetyltransferase [Pelagibaculum spongiae]PVZ67734.1 amino-acid N-acetyltransferase [Pelagibaculum spongiae]
MNDSFVHPFRDALPYIGQHRGRTVVINLPGDAFKDRHLHNLAQDISLLHNLGLRIVICFGMSPQLPEIIAESGGQLEYHQGYPLADEAALRHAISLNGYFRSRLEAMLTRKGMASELSVSSGNFVTAMPVGVRNGQDHCFGGEVRKVRVEPIQQLLDNQHLVLLPSIAASPTGELFLLDSHQLACKTAVALKADKLIQLSTQDLVKDQQGKPISWMDLQMAEQFCQQLTDQDPLLYQMKYALDACSNGVSRSHLLNFNHDGVLLQELYTRDGAGCMIYGDRYEQLRQATIEDVGGLLDLIAPLEQEGILVRRSREVMETEVDRFQVIDRDGLLIGCAALHPLSDGFGELACLAVHNDYRGGHRGEQLLMRIEQKAHSLGINQLIVLTTRTTHWFVEQGFVERPVSDLPGDRQQLYNLQRKSKILIKTLQG